MSHPHAKPPLRSQASLAARMKTLTTPLTLSLTKLGIGLGLSLALGSTAHAQQTPWPNANYTYYAQDETLNTVLGEFAAGFSLALRISPKLNALVNGSFNTATPTEFLNRLGGVYGFNWYVHAGTLYISPANEQSTESIELPDGSIADLRQALTQMGVLDPRFGWGELPEQGLALVSGPPSYVALVKRTVAALPKGESGQEVAVFKLRHASVNDRSVSYRDTQITTPGVASILRGLMSGTNSGEQALTTVAPPSKDQAEDTADTQKVAAAPTAARSLNRRQREPSIQSDARLNAIIVQDVPSRIPLYRQLIAQLDVPSTLIEIEAMIVDVNAEVVGELGVTWGARSGNTSFGYGNMGLSPSSGLPLSAGAGATPGLIGLSVGNNLVARLRALEGRGDAQILSQPSILTTDNLGAMIDLSETFYIQTRGERVAEVTPVIVGTSLRVTPRYIRGTNESQVELAIDIEDGQIQDERKIDNLPTVRKSNVSTLAIVSDTQTLLIGGYNTSQESERVDKVPLLGDIPGLGILFSSRSKSWQRRERLFLIRPRIVSIDGARITRPDMDTIEAQQRFSQDEADREIQRRRLQQLHIAPSVKLTAYDKKPKWASD